MTRQFFIVVAVKDFAYKFCLQILPVCVEELLGQQRSNEALLENDYLLRVKLLCSRNKGDFMHSSSPLEDLVQSSVPTKYWKQ